MLVELAERLGPSLDWWLTQPYAFGLWAYRHLQELDRRRQFVARMHRLEAADLMVAALHDPERIAKEHRDELAKASRSPSSDEAFRQRAAQLLDGIASGHVLSD